jgi:hypothetical protein
MYARARAQTLYRDFGRTWNGASLAGIPRNPAKEKMFESCCASPARVERTPTFFKVYPGILKSSD